jgi:hypothetical protein
MDRRGTAAGEAQMTTPRESVNGAAPVAGAEPGAATAIVTTEHFTLQGARAATVAEANGRADVFLGAVSGGLVALGLLAAVTLDHSVPAAVAAGLLAAAAALAGLMRFQRRAWAAGAATTLFADEDTGSS